MSHLFLTNLVSFLFFLRKLRMINQRWVILILILRIFLIIGYTLWLYCKRSKHYSVKDTRRPKKFTWWWRFFFFKYFLHDFALNQSHVCNSLLLISNHFFIVLVTDGHVFLNTQRKISFIWYLSYWFVFKIYYNTPFFFFFFVKFLSFRFLKSISMKIS